jgi:1,5-anhydro-D-fructose reductase (1,5-anhydro-D-mannitol-forming)
MKPLRVGIASFAHVHAAGYARLLASRPDVELVTSDPEPDTRDKGQLRGAALAAELGVTHLASYDDLFASDLDAVVVCTESSRHRALVEQAAAAGVHVLCEKPLATTMEDAVAMREACDAAGVSLMTAYPVRFHPGFRDLRQRVRRGDLGRVLAVTGTNNGQAPMASRRWFVDLDLAGGGALMDHTVHLADLLDDLFDDRPRAVYAQVNRVVHRNEVDVDTGGLVVLTYADGCAATIDCSWSAPSSYPGWGGLTLTVEGERGSASLDAFADRLEVFDDKAGGLRWHPFGVDLDSLMLEEFLGAVRDGRAPQPDGSVGCRTLEVVLSAYASARSDAVVLLEGSDDPAEPSDPPAP